MKKVAEKTRGFKTYGVAAGLVALGVALGAGWVELDAEQFNAIVALLNGVGLAALRAGVSKSGPAIPSGTVDKVNGAA